MTLVVASLVGNEIRIDCDIRLTDELGIDRGYKFGVLKAMPVALTIAVGFAGPPDPALKAIREIGLARPTSFDSVVDALIGTLPADPKADAPDYIVAATNPARITRIRKGNVETGLLTTWVGDQVAIEAYQHRLQAARTLATAGGAAPHPFALQNKAFSEVVDEGDVPSVGDAAVVLVSHEHGYFGFRPRIVGMGGSTTIDVPPNTPTLISLGTATFGAHSYSIFVPEFLGLPAVGIHLHHAKVGYLYHPMHQTLPIPFANVDAKEFVDGILGFTGVRFVGYHMNDENNGIGLLWPKRD